MVGRNESDWSIFFCLSGWFTGFPGYQAFLYPYRGGGGGGGIGQTLSISKTIVSMNAKFGRIL